jgi:hypothetical protein
MKADTAIHSDIDALTALNRDYIQSVQDGDVRRLDKILSDDFLCSNPDGSLVDKKQFLAQTAPPGRVFGEFTMLEIVLCAPDTTDHPLLCRRSVRRVQLPAAAARLRVPADSSGEAW